MTSKELKALLDEGLDESRGASEWGMGRLSHRRSEAMVHYIFTSSDPDHLLLEVKRNWEGGRGLGPGYKLWSHPKAAPHNVLVAVHALDGFEHDEPRHEEPSAQSASAVDRATSERPTLTVAHLAMWVSLVLVALLWGIISGLAFSSGQFGFSIIESMFGIGAIIVLAATLVRLGVGNK